MSGPLAVVVAGKEGLRLPDLARAVAGFRGMTVLEATMAARNARGILAEGLDAARAADLVRLLAAEGVAARALPASVLAAPPRAVLLARATPAPEGLLAEREGRALAVPWGRIRLVAVAPFTETTWKSVMEKAPPTTGEAVRDAAWTVLSHVVTGAVSGHPVLVPLPFGEDRQVEKRIPQVEFRLLLDLLLEGPAERLRVDPDDFDFSGLGDAMVHSSHANLRLLVERIAAAAPLAATSLGADLLLTGGRMTSLGYESVDDYERELRWLAAVSA